MNDPFATTATVKACFFIYANHLNTNYITNLLNLQPTRIQLYEPLVTIANDKASCISWIIETPEQISHYIEDQLEQLFTLLKPRKNILKTLKKERNINYEFRFIIKMQEKDKSESKPAKCFDLKALSFISDIQAGIMFDQRII